MRTDRESPARREIEKLLFVSPSSLSTGEPEAKQTLGISPIPYLPDHLISLGSPMSTPPSSSSASASSQFTYQTGSSYFPLPFHLQQPTTPYAAAAPPPPPPPAAAAGAAATAYAGPVYPAPPPAPMAGVYTLPQFQQVCLPVDCCCQSSSAV